jgi:hypothetical protein
MTAPQPKTDGLLPVPGRLPVDLRTGYGEKMPAVFLRAADFSACEN